jgi:transcriptional regulator with XRE-family HTH domain
LANKRNKEYAYVDEHVGNRIRVRRTLLGMSQEKLGEALGLSFQQVQKYEKGADRVSASRLVQFAKILNVPMSYFFENVPVDATSHARRLSDDGKAVPADMLTSRESLKLIRAYYGISNPALRKIVFGLIEALADD